MREREPKSDSDSQTSKTLDEEADTYAIASCLCQTKESFADSIPDAEKQVEAQ